MSKIFLEKAMFINRAPFDQREFNFNENEIAVLSSVNGKGKTTVLSHITDAFYEIARSHFPNEFEGRENKYYRVSSSLHNLDFRKPSIVYLRFSIGDEKLDYLDIRENCKKDDYNKLISIEDKIPFDNFQKELQRVGNIKKVSSNIQKETAKKLFDENILTYFPSYRYEQPGYLNTPYQIELAFSKNSPFSGYLRNPIEVITKLPQIVNWILDIALDLKFKSQQSENSSEELLLSNLNELISKILSSKYKQPLRFGIGKRSMGALRLQILESNSRKLIYPSIFNLSSGEVALLSLFGEIVRQWDILNTETQFNKLEGIVLIDEVDKHLHITLQKEVLPNLLKLFPKIQFIISSHSPFLNMGLADITNGRSKIIDLDTGLAIEPTEDKQYEEVYQMMINENDRFKILYESLKSDIDVSKELQLITEGNNTEHIQKAIEILDSTLLERINIISGAESKSGNQQLKNAYEIMSKAKHAGKFLFVWDCDASTISDSVTETENFFKFSFDKNEDHTVANKGIENLYNNHLFTEDMYSIKEKPSDYGGNIKRRIFEKGKFLNKIKLQSEPEVFNKYSTLLDKIRNILNP